MARVQDSPAFVCVYGPNGVGKTGDLGRACGPDDTLYLAPPGGLRVLPGLWRFQPEWRLVETVEEATDLIEAETKKPVGKRAKKVAIDDFTFLAERTFAIIEEKTKARDKRKLFGMAHTVVLNFRDAARYAGFHVLVTCWMSTPGIRGRDNDGAGGHYVRGGPKLPGDLPDYFPGMCDLLLRAEVYSMAQPWPAVYRCAPSTEWTTRDRDNGTPDPAPFNVGEILRSNGYDFPYPRSLSWATAFVEQLAVVLLGLPPAEDAAIVESAYQMLRQDGHAHEDAYRVVSDAWDRANLRRALAARQHRFLR
jgi:hypothetical protein